MANVKWLARIDVVGESFTGFQQAVAYRMRQHADELGAGTLSTVEAAQQEV
jgi:DMSO/TMAO reductase YedYZ molybdopterin-dependent catalytic subunit